MSLVPSNLGRLERVLLRDVWPHEALSFTPWLAQEENLKLLGDEIGMAGGAEPSPGGIVKVAVQPEGRMVEKNAHGRL